MRMLWDPLFERLSDVAGAPPDQIKVRLHDLGSPEPAGVWTCGAIRFTNVMETLRQQHGRPPPVNTW